VVVNDLKNLEKYFENILKNYINIDTSNYCRERYLKNFSLEQFEENLVRILK